MSDTNIPQKSPAPAGHDERLDAAKRLIYETYRRAAKLNGYVKICKNHDMMRIYTESEQIAALADAVKTMCAHGR